MPALALLINESKSSRGGYLPNFQGGPRFSSEGLFRMERQSVPNGPLIDITYYGGEGGGAGVRSAVFGPTDLTICSTGGQFLRQ